LVQSIFEPYHSYNRAITRIIKINKTTRAFLTPENSIGKETKTATSMSKIRNRMAMKKNWMEKGIRAKDILLKPHSKCPHFKRACLSFFLINTIAPAKTPLRKIKMNHKKVTFTPLVLFNWKLNVHLYYKESFHSIQMITLV